MYACRVPLSPDELFTRLDELGIATTTIRHPPVFTVEQAKLHRGELDGSHIKNLFLRNKKKRMWLVVALEDRPIDLKALAKLLQAGHVSFGSADRLRQYLGVEPGAVTPFGIVNDLQGAVSVVLDAGIFERDPVHCHPLTNEMTTAIGGGDLLRFLEACDHPPQVLDLAAAAPS